jgi:hypothetical protein
MAARDRPLDEPLAPETVGDEHHPQQREPHPDDHVGPARLVGQGRNQHAGAEADRERGQSGSPPRKISALVRQPRAPRGIAGLVETTATPAAPCRAPPSRPHAIGHILPSASCLSAPLRLACMRRSRRPLAGRSNSRRQRPAPPAAEHPRPGSIRAGTIEVADDAPGCGRTTRMVVAPSLFVTAREQRRPARLR